MTETLARARDPINETVALLPTKATFAPGEPIEIEARGAAGPLEVSLWHLDEHVATATAPPGANAVFPPQPEGGYGLEAGGTAGALDVLADPLTRPRYGFVARYERDRDPAGVADQVRRLHLNCVQFYDWMYRHARLLPPQDDFEDALGRSVSLATVRTLAAAVRAAGSLPLGYAAVYAVGRDERCSWTDIELLRPDGTTWALGDFLWNVDPSDERWLRFFTAELREAATQVGFAGFHLDQYGAPKRARRPDGVLVDLAEAFPRLIDRVAADLPEARLIFNNVNDFPTWSTAPTNQDATYIEVWPPHDELGHLSTLVDKARQLASAKPVILAAYLSPFRGDEATASAAERLLLATVFSHGATALLHGEERAVLTDPYYVRHVEIGDETRDLSRRYYDFAVRYGDLLFDRSLVDVTRTQIAPETREVTIDAPVPVATDPTAGKLWVRVARGAQGLLVSLIDLSAQEETVWNAPKRAPEPLERVRVGVERTGAGAIAFACPEESPGMRRLESVTAGVHDVVELPPFSTWALLWIRDEEA